MRVSPIIARFFPIIVLAIATCGTAQAREKTDIVVLKNGNQINGEIKKLARGYLSLKTDSMSTVEIKWEDVEQVTSKYFFAVEDTAGRIFIGVLQPAAESRSLNVVGPVPAKDLHHLVVVGIREVERSPWQRFSGSVSIGYTFTKASERSQLNLNSDLTYRAARYEGKFEFDYIFGSSKGEEDVNRKALTLSGKRYLTGKWLLFSTGKYEHNLELELDHRYSIQGGPGYMVSRTHRSEIVIGTGLSYTRERYFEQDSVDNAEGVAGINTQFYKLYSPKVDLISELVFIPSLTTSGRIRLEFDTKLRIEVFKDFFVNLSFYDSYDSKPPSETAAKNDYGFVTGVSWSFRR